MRKDIIEHNCDFCNKKEIESKEKWINQSWVIVLGTASGFWGTQNQNEFCSHKCLAAWALKKELEILLNLQKSAAKLNGCLICNGLGTVYCGDNEIICPGCSAIGRTPHRVVIKSKTGKIDDIVLPSDDEEILKYLKDGYLISRYEETK